jgi:hypothetical protein
MFRVITENALRWREHVERALGNRCFVAVGPIPEAAGIEWVNLITSDKLAINITPKQTIARDAWEGKDAEGKTIKHDAFSYEQELEFTITDGLGLHDEGTINLRITPDNQALGMAETAELIANAYWSVLGLMGEE